MTSTSRLRKLAATLCLIGGLAAFGSGFAQGASPITVTNGFYQRVETTAADGTVTTTLVPAARTVPGGEVVYEVAYHNTGDQPATDVAIDAPVPDALVFIEPLTPATVFSVDGGEHFGPLTELTVTDAEGKPRTAQAADVTHVRWLVPSLAPGAGGKVSYLARVR